MNHIDTMKLALEALVKALPDMPVHTDWHLEAITALREALAEQPAQQHPAPANLWLYWKVDDKSVVTGPFKTHSKDEAYGLDCIDQTPLTVAAPQPAQQEPPTVAELVCVCGAEWEWRNRDWELVATPPEQRKPWAGLTPEQRATIAEANNMLVDDDLFDAIEAELKEKNT